MSKYPNIISSTECLRIDNFLKNILSNTAMSYMWILEDEESVYISGSDGKYLEGLGYCTLEIYILTLMAGPENHLYRAKLTFRGLWILYLLRKREDHYDYHKATV